jgi:hypothetical protein
LKRIWEEVSDRSRAVRSKGERRPREAAKEHIESLTDDLAAQVYSSLEPSELDQLIADLGPISAALDAVGSR